MKIKLMVKNAYGVTRFYPACDKSELLVQFARCQTLVRPQVELLQFMGFEVEFISADLEKLQG